MKQLDWFDWRLILLFALAGPPLAVVALTLATLTQGGSGPGVFGLFFILYMAYGLGVVPASLTAIVLLATLRLAPPALRNKIWVQWSAAALIGASLSWCFFALFEAGAVTMALLGGFSGAVCTVIAAWLRVGPNDSFKPNSDRIPRPANEQRP